MVDAGDTADLTLVSLDGCIVAAILYTSAVERDDCAGEDVEVEFAIGCNS